MMMFRSRSTIVAAFAGLLVMGESQAQETIQERLTRLEQELKDVRAGKLTTQDFVKSAKPVDSSVSFGIARMDVNDLRAIPDLDALLDSVSSSVDLRLWGRAKFDAIIDNYQGSSSYDYSTYVSTEGPSEVNFNPRDTRFGFAGSSKFDNWTARGVLEMDFYGSNDGNSLLPRLRLGYMELKHKNGFSLRAGQDWLPIMKQNPNMVDFGILNRSGNVWWRVPQITLRYKNKGWEYLLSAFKHRISNAQEQEENMPVIGARIERSFKDGKVKVAVNGGWRSNSISGMDYDMYLVGVEAKAKLNKQFNVKTEWYFGQGIGREFLRYGLDYNFTTGQEIESYGGFVSVEYKHSEKIRFNAGYGVDDPEDDDLAGSAAPFMKNQGAFLNVRYLMSKNVGMGAEVIHFETDKMSGSSYDGQRVLLSWWYIF